MNYSPFQPYIYTLAEIPLNLGLALLLGMMIAIVYRATTRNSAVSRSYLLTLVMLSMICALVIMVIGNSLIRAFSLIGALSIIRFRTVVKENRDVAFIFLSLGAGMAAGIGNLQLALFGVSIILIAILLLEWTEFGSVNKGVYLLRFSVPPTTTIDALQPIFDRFLVSHSKLSIKTVRMGQFVEHSYMVRLKRNDEDKTLIAALSNLEGAEKVSLIVDDSEAEF